MRVTLAITTLLAWTAASHADDPKPADSVEAKPADFASAMRADGWKEIPLGELKGYPIAFNGADEQLTAVFCDGFKKEKPVGCKVLKMLDRTHWEPQSKAPLPDDLLRFSDPYTLRVAALGSKTLFYSGLRLVRSTDDGEWVKVDQGGDHLSSDGYAFYVASAEQVYTSNDGVTWKTLGPKQSQRDVVVTIAPIEVQTGEKVGPGLVVGTQRSRSDWSVLVLDQKGKLIKQLKSKAPLVCATSVILTDEKVTLDRGKTWSPISWSSGEPSQHCVVAGDRLLYLPAIPTIIYSWTKGQPRATTLAEVAKGEMIAGIGEVGGRAYVMVQTPKGPHLYMHEQAAR